MKDISSRADIEKAMKLFYDQALKDDQIGHFFTKVSRIDLTSHLPVICDFWDMVVFNKSGFKKDILETHLKLNKAHGITVEDSNTWLSLFEKVMDENYSGPNADKMKLRAKSIAIVIMSKVLAD